MIYCPIIYIIVKRMINTSNNRSVIIKVLINALNSIAIIIIHIITIVF